MLATDLRALPIIVGLVVLWAFFAFESNVFLTPLNLSNLLVQSTVTGIMALGLLFVLLVKEIDLSIAAINGVTAVLMAKLIVEFGVPPWLAVSVAIAVGAAIGSLSARWVTFVGVPSFVVTLGLGLALNGIQLLLLPRTARYGLMGTGIEVHRANEAGGSLRVGRLLRRNGWICTAGPVERRPAPAARPARACCRSRRGSPSSAAPCSERSLSRS